MSNDAIYPIAEEFDSLQGEGVYTGTPMRFVRLAGCNVGRYGSFDQNTALVRNPSELPILYPPGHSDVIPQTAVHSICTSVFGEKFICDTNYRKAYSRTAAEIIASTKQRHLCITGGEPFLHDLKPLLDLCLTADLHVHIETSGTHLITDKLTGLYSAGNVWITCSPKQGFLRANMHLVNEWKFVVTEGVGALSIMKFFDYPQGRSARAQTRPVFLQPVNAINEVDRASMARVMAILDEHPEWRLSVQLHKYLNLR